MRGTLAGRRAWLYPNAMRELTVKEQKALGHFLKSGDKTAAYRHAYDCARMKDSTVIQRAQELFRKPPVAARLEKHREAAAELVTMDVAQVLRDWVLLATADPNEIVQHRRSCCRHCYGIDHYYQWVEVEHALAVARAIDNKLPAPDGSGGYGFDATKDPAPQCPVCHGEGVPVVHIADSRKLKGAARLLYAGVKQTKFGIEIQLHDQERARENIAKFLGMLRPDSSVLIAAKNAVVAIGTASPEDAAREYARIMQGQG